MSHLCCYTTTSSLVDDCSIYVSPSVHKPDDAYKEWLQETIFSSVV